MLRHRAFVLLTLFNFPIQISAEQTIYSDGWIPMSHNDVYDQIRRGTTQHYVYLTKKTRARDGFDINLKVEQRTDTKKQYGNFINDAALFKVPEPDDIKKDKLDQNTENVRQAKKVWGPNINTRVDNVLTFPEVDSKVDVSTEKTVPVDVITAATSNTYEVTEHIDKSPAEDTQTTESAGYQYNPPTDENQNLTTTFYRILSKYNIKTDDRLPNYELSLQRKVQNPANVLRVPYRYNSLNHLPPDPLLAVFLSNFGFYLPSLYGIKANYNNLYGYLASNNIHNNKPFGLYKVFSDTDSWN